MKDNSKRVVQGWGVLIILTALGLCWRWFDLKITIIFMLILLGYEMWRDPKIDKDA